MKYLIVWNTGVSTPAAALAYVQEEVEQRLDDGWELQGGISVSRAETEMGTYYLIAQAMIFRE
jgi:hypothetical protein